MFGLGHGTRPRRGQGTGAAPAGGRAVHGDGRHTVHVDRARLQPKRLRQPVRVHHPPSSCQRERLLHRHRPGNRSRFFDRLRCLVGATEDRHADGTGRGRGVAARGFCGPKLAGSASGARTRRRALVAPDARAERPVWHPVGRCRRRPHARALAQTAAGRPDGHAHWQAVDGMRLRVAAECGTPSPHPLAARLALPDGVVARNPGGREPLYLQPGRAALPVSG